MIPLPEGVESFLEVSMNPATFLEAISEQGPAEGLKAQIEELTETIRSTGKVDIDKDLLSQLGPKVAIYVAPGRSAVVTAEESAEDCSAAASTRLPR